jgi:hypothetical protein
MNVSFSRYPLFLIPNDQPLRLSPMPVSGITWQLLLRPLAPGPWYSPFRGRA